ncbi:MAG: hypothetical protein ABIK64_07690, partial [Bacillota bacterium]
IPADGRSICQFEIALVDRHGVAVPDHDLEVAVSVSGGTLLGMDNGNPADHTLPGSPVRSTFRGLAYGVVRAPRKKGPVTLTFTAPGLAPVTHMISAVSP